MKSLRRCFAAALVVLLVACAFPFLTVSAQIPADAVAFRGHSYKIYLQTMSWTEAKAYCENLGGHLATITTQEEQQFVETLNKDQKQLWVGGYRDENFVWYWVTGESWSYTHWGSGEPNNSGGNETRLTVWPLEWNDLADNNLGEQSGFICEWESAASGISTWNGHRYQLFEEKKTWTEAKAYCERLGGHLATITSKEECDFVNAMLIGCADNVDVMLGMSDFDNEGDWSTWITGEPVTFTNWGVNEPDNWGSGQHICVIVCGQRGYEGGPYYCVRGQWDDNGVKDSELYFLCEWEPDSKVPVTAPVTTLPATTKAPATTRAQETLPVLVTQTTAPDGSGTVQLDGQTYVLIRYEDFNYILQQLEALIIRYLGTAQRVEIPETIEAHPVIGVSDHAFSDSQATEVVVPASVYRFGDHAFESQQGKMTIICEEGSPAAQYAQNNGNPVELRQVYTTAAPTEAATEAAAPARGGHLRLVLVIAAVVILALLLLAALILLLAKQKKRKPY